LDLLPFLPPALSAWKAQPSQTHSSPLPASLIKFETQNRPSSTHCPFLSR
jgi:hypothetical protein